MARRDFTKEIAERVLIRCRRHCCVCEKFCSTNIEIHHIEDNDDNSEENALPVCFDCHADIAHYNDRHPRGRKYQPTELRKLRELTFRKYSTESSIPSPSPNALEYGQGFHDGATLSEKRFDSQLIWNFVARHGDFAIEIVVMFRKSDSCSMMNEDLYDERVTTGLDVSQRDGHAKAWDAGLELGFWYVDQNRERLVLTRRGRFFKDLVQRTTQLRTRYEDLDAFWRDRTRGSTQAKPGARIITGNYATGGWLAWLETEKYRPIKIDGERDTFVLISVSPDEIEVQNIETSSKVSIDLHKLHSVEYDEDSGLLRLTLTEAGQQS